MNNNVVNNIKEINKKNFDKKIDEFIKWYKQYKVKNTMFIIDQDNYKNYGNIDEVKNFIELMAIWFELVINDDLVNYSIIENNFDNLYNIVFASYNKHLKNKYLLMRPNYIDMFLYSDNMEYSFVVDKNGKVLKISGIKDYSKYINKYIKEVIIDMKRNYKNITFNKIIQKIQYYEIKNEQVDRLLDTVIYKIMERGENNIGPKRAYLFAKIFKRDISIPLMHGIDFNDKYLIDFIYSYLVNNGNPNIYYYENYKNNLINKKISLKEFIKSEYYKDKQYSCVKINECMKIMNKEGKKLRKVI